MALQGRQALIVDDDSDMRLLIRKVLESAGMLVAEAGSVKQAFEISEGSSPHLVILDIRMPGEVGFKFLDRRLNHPVMRHVPVIVVSAVSDDRVIYAAMGGGASDYLVKPFAPPALIQKVRKALKDTDFKVVTFKPGSRPSATVFVQAEVTQVAETSFQLETSAKLAPSSRVGIKCEAFSRANLGSYLFQTHSHEAKRAVSGQYISRIDVVGLNETLLKKLKKRGTSA